jgi:single-strand DNA-binding protein
VAGFTLAVNREIKVDGQPEADFIPIVAWGKTAEFCSKYFAKGQQVGVIGRIQQRSWDDQEGKKHYVTEIVADRVYFAESRRDKGPQDSGEPQENPPQQQPQQQQQNKPSTPPSQQPQQPGKNNPPWMR